MRKTLSFLLCLVMLCSLVSVASAAAEFPDMPEKDYWSYAALRAAVDNGLLRGMEDGRLDPKGTLTRAQMAAVLNRAFGAKDTADVSGFRDIQAGAWYETEMAKAVRMGTFRGNGNGLMEPNAPITREQAFTVIARAFLLEDGDGVALEKFPDADEVSGYARGSLSALVEGGYIQGTQAGLEPKADITREAFAQVFYNILKTYVSSSGEYSADAEGNVMVNVPGVTLKDMKINGDLLLGEGVGSGEVVLDGTEVTGRLVIRGGGDHSIILKNNSTVGSARIGKTGDGGVRLHTEEGCRIEAVYVEDGNDVIILDGEFNQIVIDTDAPVILENVQAVGLTLKAEGADVRLQGETEVSAVLVAEKAEGAALAVDETAKVATLESQAESVVIFGDGQVDVAQVSGDNTQVNTVGTSLTVDKSAEGVSQNDKAVKAGETVVTDRTEEGTGNSSGSSGGSNSSGSADEPEEEPWEDLEEPLYTVILSEDGREDPSFNTLAEAMAEAEKNIRSVDNSIDGGEESIYYYYAPIVFTGTDTLTELVLPKGYVLSIFGRLTVSGKFTAGMETEASLRDGMTETALYIEANAEDQGALYTAEQSIGFYSDCDIQFFGQEEEDGLPVGLYAFFADDWSYCGIVDADVKVNADSRLAGFSLENWEEIEHTLTVSSGATLELEYCHLQFPTTVEQGAELDLLQGVSFEDGFALVNNGVVALSTWVDFNGSAFVNNGELRVCVREDENGEAWNSGLNLNEGACLENNGIIYVESREEAGAYCCIRGSGGKLLNRAQGTIKNDGFIELWSGSILENAGILENSRRINLEPGNDRSMIREGGEPVLEESAAACTFVNSGTLNNSGDLELRGAKVTLDGVINNSDGWIWSGSEEKRTWTMYLEKVQGDPDEETNPVWWDEEGCWRILHEEDTVTGIIPCTVTIGGTLLNKGDFRIESGDLTIDKEATLTNEGSINIDRHWGYSDLYDPKITVKGTLVSGAITAVGEEFNGSGGWYWQGCGTLDNQGSITNNGGMTLRDVDYTQTASGSLVTYNTSAMDLTGCIITVPHGGKFMNEGHLYITDRYGEEYRPCDLDGFEDFFTIWQENGNDSHWCDYRVEVYDWEGFLAAEKEQEERITAWEQDWAAWSEGDPEPIDRRYNGMWIQGDLTLEADAELGSFGSYWLEHHQETAWQKWDDAALEWLPAQPDEEDAFAFDTWVGSTITVPQGITLTVARDNALRLDGTEEQFANFIPDTLKVEGTLVIQGKQEEDWEQGIPHMDPGLVEIWSYGSFVCTGAVENEGVFEVRYHEGGLFNEDQWEMVYDGSIFRPAECPVTGAPDNAVYAFEARTLAGLKTAAVSSEPAFNRVYIRDDCAITVTESVTLPMDMNIEPGSGLIVEHGSGLTLGRHLWNDGDITVEGALSADSLDNNQSITLGAVGSNEAALLKVNGEMNNRPGAWLRAYNSASTLSVGSASVDVTDGFNSGFNVRTWDEFNQGLEVDWSVLQIDADLGETPVKLCGVMQGYNELRIMQGNVDLTQLDASAVDVISISDMWTTTRVALGGNNAELRSHIDGEYTQWGFGIEITDAKDAEIRIPWSDVAFAGPSKDDYISPWVSVNGYMIDPHIFGAREYTEEPGVYIGIDDDSVLYELYVGGQQLQHEDEYRADGEDKTHLLKKDGEDWFAAGPNDDPGLEMTILLPEGVTVTVDHVPVKPEWEELQS